MKKILALAFSALCLTMPIDSEKIYINGLIAEAATSQTAVVTGSYVNLRSGPGTNHTSQGQVTKGEKLSILSKQGDWYQVKKSNGQAAWIASWLIKVENNSVSTPPASTTTPTPTTSETAVVTGTKVNLRGGPGTSHPIQGEVKQGDKLPVLGKQGDWLKVKQSDGKEAWLASWLAKVESTTVTTPTTSKPTTSIPASNTTTTTSETAVVTGTKVNLRDGPGTSHPIQGEVKQGDKLPVLGKQGDWLKVKQSDGKEAWLASWLVKVESTTVTTPTTSIPTSNTTTTTSETAVVTGTKVNLRGGPGTSHPVQGEVKQGDKLPVLDKQGDWLKVKQSDGKEAWLASWLAKVESITVNVPESTIPTSPPATSTEVASRGNDIDRDMVAWLPSPSEVETDEDIDEDNNNNGKDEAEEFDGPRLTDLEIEKDDDKTIIKVEADTILEYNTFFLNNPNRLVINFEGVHLGELPESQKVSSSIVQELRTGQFSTEPMIARMVVDLAAQVSYHTSTSKQGKVLEIELTEVKYSDSVEGKVIFIDAGHGGNDPGASGYSRNTWEEDVNLDMALKLAAILKQQGAVVEMSRTSDQTVDLNERPNMANRVNADIFVSIHSNANNNNSLQGTSTYFYAPSSRPDLYAQRTDRQRLAQNIQTEMVQYVNLPDKNIREANFAVLRESFMPSVLVETAYISNSEEEKLLADSNFRQRVAEAIARGINAYFSGK